jgi:hypothetical protein
MKTKRKKSVCLLNIMKNQENKRIKTKASLTTKSMGLDRQKAAATY